MVLIRRKGIAIVHNSKGILLVSGRSKRFTLPGGGAKHGESREKATIRELYEETGLKTKKINFLFKYIGNNWTAHSGRIVRNHTKVFLVESEGIPRPRNEISYISYWKPNSELSLTNSTKKVIEKYLLVKS